MKNNRLKMRFIAMGIASIAMSLSYSSSVFATPEFGSVYNPARQYAIAKELLTETKPRGNANNAIKWLRLAAAQQHPEALYQLGRYTERGVYGVPQNYNKAIALYKTAALKGHVTSRLSLSNLFLNQDLHTYDPKWGQFWLEQAAHQNHAQAQFSLAMLYKDQPPSADNKKAVLNWLNRSAANGHQDAQYTLGIYYLEGEFLPLNPEKALYWLTQSANQGDAPAQYSLGLMYQNGKGTPQDQKKSVYWYRRAATQQLPDAQFQLGRKYLMGEGTIRNLGQGIKLITQAAEASHPAAQTMLATHLMIRDQQKEDDIARAFELYLSAARKDYPEAQFRVSVMFAKGQGVTKDEEKSVHWITKAAKQNHPTAQYGLGAYLFNGVGVEKDLFLAAYWMSRAAMQGQKHALESKDRVLELLDDSQLDHLDKQIKMIDQPAEK